MILTKEDLQKMPPKIRSQLEKQMGVDDRRNKFNNKHTVGDNGRIYPSILQAQRAAELRVLERAGEIACLCEEVSFPLKAGISYRADFTYFDFRKGKFIVEDSKGKVTKEYAMKRKLFRDRYGFSILETGGNE